MSRMGLRHLISPASCASTTPHTLNWMWTKIERRSQLPFLRCKKTSFSFQTEMNQCRVGLSKVSAQLAITNAVVLPASGARTDAGVFPTSQAQTASRSTHSYLKGRLVPCWVHELASACVCMSSDSARKVTHPKSLH